MAPEQVEGDMKKIGPRTDVYAAGAVLYELLSGRPPFVARSGGALYKKILMDEPLPPSAVNPRVGREIEAIALKCLEKFPARRYPSAQDLAHDLHAFLTGEPISARPPGLGTRLAKKARRHRVGVALVSLAALVAIGSAWFLAAAAKVPNEHEDREHLQRELDRLERELAWFRGQAAPRAGPPPGDGGGLAAAELLAWSREALRDGNEEAAWAFWDRARALDPSAWELWLFRAEHRLSTGEVAGALEDLRLASRLAPGETRVGRELARACLEAGEIEEALAEADGVLAAQPGDPVALSVRVRVFLRSGPADEAEAANAAFDRERTACRRLDAGERLDRFYLERIRLEGARNKGEGAWAELAGAVDGFDGPQWQRALVSADAALLVLGDLAGADDSIREARAWIELARARALGRRAEGRRVLSAIERGLTIDPQGPHLLAEHGWILWKADPSATGVEERAVEELRAATAAAPRFILAHARLTEVLLDSGRLREAREEVETLASLAPNHPDLPRLRRELEE
ncbi:MAG: hypothetical protein HY720_22690 [Planctomycetes bacterium]|nr:hypothetical protein [Planctomycetota bacterium]